MPILLTLKGCLAGDGGGEEEKEEEKAALCKTELGLRRLGECSNITAEARAARPKQESPRPNESCSGGRREGGGDGVWLEGETYSTTSLNISFKCNLHMK